MWKKEGNSSLHLPTYLHGEVHVAGLLVERVPQQIKMAGELLVELAQKEDGIALALKDLILTTTAKKYYCLVKVLVVFLLFPFLQPLPSMDVSKPLFLALPLFQTYPR